MALRSSHGAARQRGLPGPRVEVAPANEQPVGLPAPARPSSPTDRGPAGRFAGGNQLASAGGQARAGQTRFASRLGLTTPPETSEFLPYRRSASSFAKAHTAYLAAVVGGGRAGPAVRTLVQSAALQLGWSRYLSDRAAVDGDTDLALLASRLADASRQNLLAAHELCSREALARGAGRAGNDRVVVRYHDGEVALTIGSALDDAIPVEGHEVPTVSTTSKKGRAA